jgi:peptidoglycan/LPS O-acetylase OafA/YrhL
MKFLGKLSRITSPGRQFIPQIDGLRFIALVMVIAFHVWAIGSFHMGRPGDSSILLARCMATGSMGVQLFFVISGFILALPFARHYLQGAKKIRLREYFSRRLSRIEPPYLIQLAIVFCLTALVLRKVPSHLAQYGSAGWWGYTWPHMLASVFYSSEFIYKDYPYPNIVLWSLEVEVSFYILAPLLACLFAISNRWGRRALIFLLILAWPNLVALGGLQGFASQLWILHYMPYFSRDFYWWNFIFPTGLFPRANISFGTSFFYCAAWGWSGAFPGAHQAYRRGQFSHGYSSWYAWPVLGGSWLHGL